MCEKRETKSLSNTKFRLLCSLLWQNNLPQDYKLACELPIRIGRIVCTGISAEKRLTNTVIILIYIIIMPSANVANTFL